MKFEEGIWYSFSISGIVDIPDKGEYYILLHATGRKMLLRTDYYVKYNFVIGQFIQCRVDKVNCTGQVFLEPIHPYYNEGQVYSFEIVRTFSDKDALYNLTVLDFYGNNIDVFVSNSEEIVEKSTIQLKVKHVKKGIPILIELRDQNVELIETSVKEIKLIVKDIKCFNSEDYFVLSNGTQHSKIKVKHYQKYGFGIGDEILCDIIAKESNNHLVIEPKNPWYRIGGIYEFENVKTEEFVDLEGKISHVAVVFDKGGNKCGVPIADDHVARIKGLNRINCKVVGFRKGRPHLEIDLLS